MKLIICIVILFLTLSVSAYEYVYCENLKTHEWHWLLDEQGEAVWTHGHILIYLHKDQDEIYEFGSMPISKKVFNRLHQLCIISFGKNWVPHPGGWISDWNLFHYKNSENKKIFSEGYVTHKRIRYVH